MIRSNIIALWSGTACILLGIALTGHITFLGSLIGYWVGFVNTLWGYHDTKRSSELDIRSAIRRMRWSLMTRLGMITLVVVAVARFKASSLFSLAFGIAIGVIVSFITVAINKIQGERGDKKSA